jgi:hypothetical protein
MHPYIAYLILSNPTCHRARRPDESVHGLPAYLARLWQRHISNQPTDH